jgi:hypothetical protein
LETWRPAESLGITQAIVTSVGREETIAKLNILGIYNENLVVVAGDNVRLAKPHREPYQTRSQKAADQSAKLCSDRGQATRCSVRLSRRDASDWLGNDP